jgi:hypothetical protein
MRRLRLTCPYGKHTLRHWETDDPSLDKIQIEVPGLNPELEPLGEGTHAREDLKVTNKTTRPHPPIKAPLFFALA